MKKFTQLNIKDKFKSYSLSFENKELLDSVEENIHNYPSSNVLAKDRRAWFKKPLPSVVEEIDNQLREFYNIDQENKMVFSLYYPPDKVNGKFKEQQTIISDQKENVYTRIIICTVQEQVEITFGKSKSEKMIMSPWDAYQTPPMIGPMLEYSFENKNHMQLEARKGFRSVRKSKKIEDRHILVFDYILSDKNMAQLGDFLKKFKK